MNSTSKVKSTPRRDPTDRERARIEEAKERCRNRRLPPRVSSESDPGNRRPLRLAIEHADDPGGLAHLMDTFGTNSQDLTQLLASQLAGFFQPDPGQPVTADLFNAAFAAVHGIAPQNEAEAMLAVQMAGTHSVAMSMLRKAQSAQTVDALREFGNLATKLLRAYTDQTEALAKLRRGGEQKVRVEHVHVHQGGQAIVGNVSTGGGGHERNDGQPHALGQAGLPYAPGTPVRSPDAFGEPVPIASGAGQKTLPDARRRQGKRRA